MFSEQSFTLIELIIVIGILAILAVVVVVVINPVEFLAQSRDATRLSDLQTINKAIGIYQSDGGTSFGTSTYVYVAIPDSSQTCNNLGLPTLPSGYSYSCSNSTNYRKVNGTGWIPVNLTNVSFGSPLNTLPVDPVNTTSSGNYYTYTPGGSWELNGILESSKYRNDSKYSKYNLPGILAVGTNLNLSPIANNTGLVGYWKFDEGTGTTATDSSGNGNTGTLTNGPSWISGQIGGALSFDGSNDYIETSSVVGNVGVNDFSISFWVKRTETGRDDAIFSKEPYGTKQLYIRITGNKAQLFIRDAAGTYQVLDGASTIGKDAWYHIVTIRASGGLRIYTNGVLDAQETSTPVNFTTTANPSYFGYVDSVADFYLHGILDDVRIYNRVLSAAEIQAIYNATR